VQRFGAAPLNHCKINLYLNVSAIASHPSGRAIGSGWQGTAPFSSCGRSHPCIVPKSQVFEAANLDRDGPLKRNIGAPHGGYGTRQNAHHKQWRKSGLGPPDLRGIRRPHLFSENRTENMRPARGWLFEPRADSITVAFARRTLEEPVIDFLNSADDVPNDWNGIRPPKNLRRRARNLMSRRRLSVGP